jgi:hypothetical protein
MNKVALVLLFCLISSLCTVAQHPLEGTWEMVSISGTNADGEKFYLDTTTVKETKIITATHYILIATDKEKDSWTFNRCYAGTVRMHGDKYYETPLVSSLRIFENVSTDFHWEIKGDRFIQSGSITRPDGKKIILDQFIFRRSKERSTLVSEQHLGTWKLPSPQEGLLVVTPDHWMTIIKNGDKLVDASGGIFAGTKDAPVYKVQYSSTGKTAAIPIKIKDRKIVYDQYTFDKL